MYSKHSEKDVPLTERTNKFKKIHIVLSIYVLI